MPVIGTAGHVDHGKSTLVRALTGIDPDRLAEEKRRGMTIDLGFAHMALPDGREVGVVDVPGHARFLPNMLAGVHGLDAVLLVVAADEGVMPQTREHLDIVGLVGVDRVVVALTKVDATDAATVAAARDAVRNELEARGVSARVIPVASPDGAGVEEVRAAIADMCDSDKSGAVDALPRLPIDRAFMMAGFGPVVTGTLVDGALEVGQTVEVAPASVRARIRGLQQHGRSVERVAPGSRVAVNLQGVERANLSRGRVLAPPGSLAGTSRVDARVRLLADSDTPLRTGDQVAVFAGTADTSARVSILEGRQLEPGAEGWVQLRLADAIAVREGDIVVLRRPSPPMTIGGGPVADTTPAAARRRSPGVTESLARRQGDGRLGEELRRAAAGVLASELAVRLGLDQDALETALAGMASTGSAVALGSRYFSAERWREIEADALDAVAAFHRANPASVGIPKPVLAGSLKLPRRDGGAAVDAVVAAGLLVAHGATVALPGRSPELGRAQQAAVERALSRLATDPLSPPRASELEAEGVDEGLRRYMEAQGLAIRVAPDMLMLPGAVADAEARLRAFFADHDTATVAQARDVLGSSRKTVVPLLEYFDGHRVTRREGDVRRLRS